MKRKRIVVCDRDGVYHLMSRCCLGEHLLEDGEKEMFIGMMRRQAAFCGVDILAYSIMSNHFHILARVRHEKPQTDAELLSRYRAFHEGCR
ncbi:MAG: transposase, partial [Opitutales bacterium]|nr:transposase [Opitutales bacterium]